MTQPTPDPRFAFDPRLGATGRYRAPNGRIISAAQARDILDRTLANAADPIKDLSTMLREGTVSLEDWRLQMRTQIKNSHIASMAAQKGGFDQLSQSDYGRVGQIIRTQYDYLENFTQQIADGTQRLDGTLQRRMQQYTDAGRDTYNTFGRLAAADKGYDQVGSIRTPADSCEECIAYDGHWYWMDSFASVDGGPARYKPPGNRICHKNCKCIERTRKSGTDEVSA